MGFFYRFYHDVLSNLEVKPKGLDLDGIAEISEFQIHMQLQLHGTDSRLNAIVPWPIRTRNVLLLAALITPV